MEGPVGKSTANTGQVPGGMATEHLPLHNRKGDTPP